MLERGDLLEPPEMPRFAGEGGPEKRRDDVLRQGGADDTRPDADHVHVVVLDRLMRCVRVVAHRRPDFR